MNWVFDSGILIVSKGSVSWPWKKKEIICHSLCSLHDATLVLFYKNCPEHDRVAWSGPWRHRAPLQVGSVPSCPPLPLHQVLTREWDGLGAAIRTCLILVQLASMSFVNSAGHLCSLACPLRPLPFSVQEYFYLRDTSSKISEPGSSVPTKHFSS